MQVPAAKRPRLEGQPPGGGSGAGTAPRTFFQGVKVFVPKAGIPFASTKARIWQAGVQRHGGALTQDPEAPGITHVVVGDGGMESVPPQLQPAANRPASSRVGQRPLAALHQGTGPATPRPSSKLGSRPRLVPGADAAGESSSRGQPGLAGSDSSSGGGRDGGDGRGELGGSGGNTSNEEEGRGGGLKRPDSSSRILGQEQQLLGQGGKQDGRGRGQSAGSTAGKPSTQQQQQQYAYVSEQWLMQCLSKQEMLPPADFPPPEALDVSTPSFLERPPSRTGDSLGSAAASGSSRLSRQQVAAGAAGAAGLSAEALDRWRWLGAELWHPACASMNLNELTLQAVYNEQRSRRVGNEPVVAALKELSRYERALHEDYYDDEQHGQPDRVNHRALRYSKAASMVRACAYKLQPGLHKGQLPFVGDVTARQITEILERGSCDALDCFRADIAVTDSRGKRRWDSVGGATRARFHALPGVGQKSAKRWWDLGCRSYEDVLLAAEPGGALAPGGTFPLTLEQRFSLEHSNDLLEGTSAEEVQEMMGVVMAALEAVSCPGWQVEVVGGGRRSSAFHDADLLVTHPSCPMEGVVLRLKDHLVTQGHILPAHQAMCRVQAGLMPTHIEKLKSEHIREQSAAPSMQTMDKFDHIYGVFRTAAGKVRRLDVIFTPPEEWAFGLVGWIGSRQYLRFMRQHAKDQGMYLTSHRLLRKVGGESLIVPDEAAPLEMSGQERWPPGWRAGRRVEAEQDVFELLGIPWREPADRDAP